MKKSEIQEVVSAIRVLAAPDGTVEDEIKESAHEILRRWKASYPPVADAANVALKCND